MSTKPLLNEMSSYSLSNPKKQEIPLKTGIPSLSPSIHRLILSYRLPPLSLSLTACICCHLLTASHFLFFSNPGLITLPVGVSPLSGGEMSHILSRFLYKTLVKSRMWGRSFQRPSNSVLGELKFLVLMTYSGWNSK